MNPPTQPTRVSVMNDYEVVVRGLTQMLEPYRDRICVVELVVGSVPQASCDIVLYDTFAAEQGGSLDCEAILEMSGAAHLVVWSWNVAQDLVDATLSAGASGYLSKQLAAEELVDALERVSQGQVVTCPAPVRTSAALNRGDWPGRQQGLTQREAEVIALISQGLSNQEIADRAYLSINTVKSYIRSSYRKMGVVSRSRAVLWSLEHGFRPDRPSVRPPGDER